MSFAEERYQDLLTRGGLEKRLHPSLEGVRKLDDSGFIDRLYILFVPQSDRISGNLLQPNWHSQEKKKTGKIALAINW
jgi:hypothetical protein